MTTGNTENQSLQQIVDSMKDAQLEIKVEKSITDITTSQSTETPVKELTAIEKEAMSMEWVPLDQFQGDKDNWVDAKEYVRVGKLIKGRDEKTKKLESELKELKSVTEHVLASMKKTEQQAYDRALKDLESRLTRAKEIGDVNEALAINQQQLALQQEIQQQSPQPTVTPVQNAELKEFAESEKWVTGKDRISKAMRTVATDLSNEFTARNPGASTKEELDYVKAEMRKEFPHYYEKEDLSTTKQAVLSSSSTKPQTSRTKSGIEALGSEERKIVEFLKAKGYDTSAYIETMAKS